MSWIDSKPHVRVRHGADRQSELVPAAGLELNYRAAADTPRLCLGHKPFRENTPDYHDCLNAPEPGRRTCERCSIVEATFASNLHHAHTRGAAELDPAIREGLRAPNRLYLAAFRDGSIKVGTSNQRRSQRRLEEQGAWVARYVALADDGFAVRDLEDLVTRELGLAQAVSANRKVRGLVSPLPDEQLLDSLRSHANGVTELIDSASDERITPLDEVWRHPMADHPAVDKLFPYPSKLTSGGHDLVVTTAIGRTAIASRPGGADMFAIDLGPLFGLQLDIGGAVADEITIQDSLF